LIATLKPAVAQYGTRIFNAVRFDGAFSIVKVMRSSFGNFVVWRSFNPRSFQSSVEGMNKFTSTPSSSWK
jgi:hypothetical protein